MYERAHKGGGTCATATKSTTAIHTSDRERTRSTKYLSARVRELVPDLESHKVPHKRHSTGLEYTPPYPRSFRLRSGDSVGGWGADVPRTLGEAEPRATTRGASGQFMGSKYPGLYSDDWDVDGRIHDMDEEGVDVQLLVNPGGPEWA